MYLEHFALRDFPFSLTSDTRFFVEQGDYRDALDVLDYALSTGECFARVTGASGTGKTIVCRALLESFAAPSSAVHLNGVYPDAVSLLDALAHGLGLARGGASGEGMLLEHIRRALLVSHDEGTSVVLVVDDAQALPDSCLETLRLLSDLESGSRKLLQIVLFGLPALSARLARNPLRPVEQRIAYGCELKPLSREASDHYLRHRLSVAGRREDVIFGPRAVRAIHRASGGVPRLVNILSHKSMLAAFGRGDRTVDRLHVRRAVSDTDGISTMSRKIRSSSAAFLPGSPDLEAFVHRKAPR